MFGLFLGACDYNDPEDYNPKQDFENFKAAKAEAAKLASAKPVDPAVAALEEAKKNYYMLCSSCHGADGKANTPTAAAFNPKPRNLTDASWQGSVDDAHIAKVIKEGPSRWLERDNGTLGCKLE